MTTPQSCLRQSSSPCTGEPFFVCAEFVGGAEPRPYDIGFNLFVGAIHESPVDSAVAGHS